MEWIIIDFLKSEKTLYLFAGIIGIVSIIIGLLFLMFSNYRSFAFTMLALGVLEAFIMFPIYLKHHHKSDESVASYNNNPIEFIETESLTTEKALNTFFWLKLVYGISIVLLIIAMSYINPKSLIFGIFTALILHLSFAITIDNFGEIYTKEYLTELKPVKK